MRIGLVTSGKIPHLVESERPLIQLFGEKKIHAEPVIWNDPSVEWSGFDILIIRSIWDYHLYPDRFVNWLDLIDQKEIMVLNDVNVLRANMHKFYLKDLERQGVQIIPTYFVAKTKHLDLTPLRSLSWQKAVIKPAISASAFGTASFELTDLDAIRARYQTMALERDLLVQEFAPEIQSFGELSIIFFNRKYSHCVLKKPSGGEFRVQEEYGGSVERFVASLEIIKTAGFILNLIPGDILYARIDGIIRDDDFVLMEIELIEPHLFFDFNIDALDRFVASVLAFMKK